MELKTDNEDWRPIAAIDLREQLAINEDELAFDPGTSAMGLVPRDVLQWSRTAAYAGSAAGRRTRGEV